MCHLPRTVRRWSVRGSFISFEFIFVLDLMNPLNRTPKVLLVTMWPRPMLPMQSWHAEKDEESKLPQLPQAIHPEGNHRRVWLTHRAFCYAMNNKKNRICNRATAHTLTTSPFPNKQNTNEYRGNGVISYMYCTSSSFAIFSSSRSGSFMALSQDSC